MKSFINALPGVVGIVTLALASGCTAAGANDNDHDMEEPELEQSDVSPEVSCFAGVWIETIGACSCPDTWTGDYTLECQAFDCTESALLALDKDNAALRVTVRSSAVQGRLSAVGPKLLEGTWKEGNGRLQLNFDHLELPIPAKCGSESLSLKGSPLLRRARQPLSSAIWWAWDHDHWLDAPYAP